MYMVELVHIEFLNVYHKHLKDELVNTLANIKKYLNQERCVNSIFT